MTQVETQKNLTKTSGGSFLSFRQEMENAFDNFFKNHHWGKFKNWNDNFTPATNIIENAKEIKVTAELPGMDEKDIQLTVCENSLIIKGEKKNEKEEKEENRYLLERSYGSFYRNISLPSLVDIEKVEAKFKNGVLEVHLPKKEEPQKKEKKVEIKTAA